VHDPPAAKMGGVAGHAGLFSTVEDLAVFAQMLLQQGEFGGVRVMSAATVAEMTRARDSGGQLRGLGWDCRSAYSRNRGELMSPRAFGHGGFTGTAMWIDPGLDLYVIFLSNRLHPDGNGEVNTLAGRIGTIACAAFLEPSAGASQTARGSVRLGIDVLVANGFKELDGSASV
jgi:CubicO group peptidase (beta-lactamase class C family)